ncbi:GntR family transcriptional regulator [Exilibacterium tricleocarpae]|uniref:GntR family transcriptional regulator n=1 Tax=Exilibacterium tricleocarpae TaxID=2591008 RepID=A0A545ST60_9GAMM|nr:GntR family transcriptional regulator [Exilibacterium tricleocarpae]TQV68151.1 GntR family transcriptional regulator [Exilibacterium tricleocarpae]
MAVVHSTITLGELFMDTLGAEPGQIFPPFDEGEKLKGSESLTQSQTALARLRNLILSAKVEAGSKLRAAALAEQLGVSRTPIRNALAVLESEGLVDYSSNCGYTAREFGLRDVLDAIEVRAGLEAMGVRILAERGFPEEMQNFALQQVKAGRDLLERGEWPAEAETAWYNHNYNFHRTLVLATNNRYLRNTITATLIIPTLGDSLKVSAFGIKGDFPSQDFEGVPGHIWESQVHHERLLKAIGNSDAVRAQNIMREHVLLSRDRVAAGFE